MMKHLLEHRRLGAQVLQACLGNASSIFYLSPLSVDVTGPESATAPARGGVPVLFPQFADKGPLLKHGLVRAAHWNLLEEEALQGRQRVRYGLDIQPNDFPLWPYAARLSLTVEASPDVLVFALQVTNTGHSSWRWTGGLHPYFAVQDLLTCCVSGLAGSADELAFSAQPFERLYDACPPVTLITGRYSLHLSATGFDQWMVWNPGEAGAAALADLPAGDWRQFVCIEPVCVNRPVVLAPGETFHGHLRIQMTEQASGKPAPYQVAQRRTGDIAACYADPTQALALLGWRAERGLDAMCADTWHWQSANPNGYGVN